jgi:hypothetical protein
MMRLHNEKVLFTLGRGAIGGATPGLQGSHGSQHGSCIVTVNAKSKLDCFTCALVNVALLGGHSPNNAAAGDDGKQDNIGKERHDGLFVCFFLDDSTVQDGVGIRQTMNEKMNGSKNQGSPCPPRNSNDQNSPTAFRRANDISKSLSGLRVMRLSSERGLSRT